MQDLQGLLQFLVTSPLDFVIVGGFAAVLHGCSQTTQDIDICVALSPDQLETLRQVLAPIHPRHRKLPDKPSFLTHLAHPTSQREFYLATDFGVLDIISHVEEVGDYIDVLRRADEIELYGQRCFVIGMDDLIRSKKALGRHRDLAVVEELEAIKNERG